MQAAPYRFAVHTGQLQPLRPARQERTVTQSGIVNQGELADLLGTGQGRHQPGQIRPAHRNISRSQNALGLPARIITPPITDGEQLAALKRIMRSGIGADIGAELIWGNREVESGADGDLRRIHTTVKYSF